MSKNYFSKTQECITRPLCLELQRLIHLLVQGYRKQKSPQLARILDHPVYDLTVFKLHFGPMTLKLYDKGPRVLRVEAIVHNAKGLRCGRSIEKLPIMLAKLQKMTIDFLNVVQAAHKSFLPDDALDSLGDNLLDIYRRTMASTAEHIRFMAERQMGLSNFFEIK